MRNFFALLTSLLLHLLLAWGAVRLLQTPPEAPPPYREIDLDILALPADVAQPIKSDEEALSSPAPVKASEREPIKEEAPEETKVEPEEVKEAPKEAAPRPDKPKPTPKAKPKEKPKPKEEKAKDKPKKEKPAATPKPKKSKEPRPEPKPREEPREREPKARERSEREPERQLRPREQSERELKARDQREREPERKLRPRDQRELVSTPPRPPAPTRVPPSSYSGNRPANSFSNRPPANFSNAPPGNRPAAAPANPANGRPAPPPPKAAPKPDGSALKSYQNGLRRAIERHKPRNARSKGLVVVAFQVSGSGALTNVRIAQSSGNEALDRAALGAVQNTGSYEPPPGGQGFGVQLPIRFD